MQSKLLLAALVGVGAYFLFRDTRPPGERVQAGDRIRVQSLRSVLPTNVPELALFPPGVLDAQATLRVTRVNELDSNVEASPDGYFIGEAFTSMTPSLTVPVPRTAILEILA